MFRLQSKVETASVAAERKNNHVQTVIDARYRLGPGTLRPRHCSSGRRRSIRKDQRYRISRCDCSESSGPVVSDQPGLEANARRGALTDESVAALPILRQFKIAMTAIGRIVQDFESI